MPRLTIWSAILSAFALLAPAMAEAQPYPVSSNTGSVFDPSRGREIAFTAYLPGVPFRERPLWCSSTPPPFRRRPHGRPPS